MKLKKLIVLLMEQIKQYILIRKIKVYFPDAGRR
jgi:hypothetical protein